MKELDNDTMFGINKPKQYRLKKDFNYVLLIDTEKLATLYKGEILVEDEKRMFVDIYGKVIEGTFVPIVKRAIVENNPEYFEEVKPKTEDSECVLQLYKISGNIYYDGRAGGKTYKIELVRSHFETSEETHKRLVKEKATELKTSLAVQELMLSRYTYLSKDEKELIDTYRSAKNIINHGKQKLSDGISIILYNGTITIYNGGGLIIKKRFYCNL